MPLNTLIFSILLIILGVGGYVAAPADARSVTALIPAFAGLLFFAIAVAALANAGLRKHLMHASAALALICMIAPLGRALPTLFKNLTDLAKINVLAITSQLVMAALCAAYLILCVRSFKAARRARLAAKAA